jgi:4a-hydroxytetrahydrobiopterin dehydratase
MKRGDGMATPPALTSRHPSGAPPFDVEDAQRIFRAMTKPLTPAKISKALPKLPGWKSEGDVLTKTFKFGSFREALSFMVHVGFEAEEMNHHPDWTNVYNRVVIRLSTHDAGDKVTAKDIDLATRIQKISWVG